MKLKLYVVRHGQVEANTKHLIVSTTDIELNDTGKKQVEELSKKIEQLEYDKIISSPLKRTKQTAEMINKKKRPIVWEDRLIERRAGNFENVCTDTFNFKPYANYLENLDCPNGEKIVDFCDRVWEFLNELEEKYNDKNIILVTHHGVCRAIAAYYQGLPEDGDLTKYHQNNGEIIEYCI